MHPNLFADFNGLPVEFDLSVDFYQHDGIWSNRKIPCLPLAEKAARFGGLLQFLFLSLSKTSCYVETTTCQPRKTLACCSPCSWQTGPTFGLYHFSRLPGDLQPNPKNVTTFSNCRELLKLGTIQADMGCPDSL